MLRYMPGDILRYGAFKGHTTTLKLSLHYHYTTTTLPLHYHYTAITLPLHHRYTTPTLSRGFYPPQDGGSKNPPPIVWKHNFHNTRCW